MHARIFYGSYNAVAMHRIVMCKSPSDKHIDSKCRGWLWQEEMFHRDHGFSFSKPGCSAVSAQHRDAGGGISQPCTDVTELAVLLTEIRWVSVGTRATLEEAEETPFGKLRAQMP